MAALFFSDLQAGIMKFKFEFLFFPPQMVLLVTGLMVRSFWRETRERR